MKKISFLLAIVVATFLSSSAFAQGLEQIKKNQDNPAIIYDNPCPPCPDRFQPAYNTPPKRTSNPVKVIREQGDVIVTVNGNTGNCCGINTCGSCHSDGPVNCIAEPVVQSFPAAPYYQPYSDNDNWWKFLLFLLLGGIIGYLIRNHIAPVTGGGSSYAGPLISGPLVTNTFSPVNEGTTVHHHYYDAKDKKIEVPVVVKSPASSEEERKQ